MSVSANEAVPRAWKVSVSRHDLRVILDDGRKLTVPLAWFPRLFNATPRQRAKFELIDDGEGIHWPAVDEDLSVAGLLRGTPAPGGRVRTRARRRRAATARA